MYFVYFKVHILMILTVMIIYIKRRYQLPVMVKSHVLYYHTPVIHVQAHINTIMLHIVVDRINKQALQVQY